jgi:hypothetical protein
VSCSQMGHMCNFLGLLSRELQPVLAGRVVRWMGLLNALNEYVLEMREQRKPQKLLCLGIS